MTSFEHILKDDELAAVLTYVRNAWSNKSGSITKEQVAKVRGCQAILNFALQSFMQVFWGGYLLKLVTYDIFRNQELSGLDTFLQAARIFLALFSPIPLNCSRQCSSR